jgi:hypothetical protein
VEIKFPISSYQLRIGDRGEAGKAGPSGELMFNFIEVQPYLED